MKKIKSHRSFGGETQFFRMDSETVKAPMSFSLFVPQEVEGGLIYLSGLTCTEENFIMKAGAQRVASELNLALICPDTSPRGLSLPGIKDSIYFGEGAGMYVDATEAPYSENYKMFSFVNDELYDFFVKEYGLQNKVSVMGHSMGGHGALISALKRPNQYSSVSALAPIVNPIKADWCREAFRKYLGEDEQTWKAYDSCELVKAGQLAPSEILIDQGTDDEALDRSLLVENLNEVCKKAKQTVVIDYHNGYDHSYYFVSTFIEKHLRFHKERLQNP